MNAFSVSQMEFKDLKEFLRFADIKNNPEQPVYGYGLLQHEKLPIRLATNDEYARGAQPEVERAET